MEELVKQLTRIADALERLAPKQVGYPAWDATKEPPFGRQGTAGTLPDRGETTTSGDPCRRTTGFDGDPRGH